VKSRPAPAREFRLFVGVDVVVRQEEGYHHVTNYQNNRVLADGEMVPLVEVDDLRFNFATKLGRHPLRISGVETKLVESRLLNQTDIMRNQQGLDEFVRVSQPSVVATSLDPADSFEDMVRESDALDDPVLHAEQLSFAQSTEHSALQVKATISSPVEVSHAYLVGLATIASDEQAPQEVLFMHRLGNIGPKPRTITARKEGLPPKFEVTEVKLHVYRNGEELVSDQSAKQFALTREEVIEYLVLDHASRHRRQTLPPEPFWSLAPSSLLAAQQPEHYNYPVTVQVDATGRVATFDSNFIIPERVKVIIEDMFFLPALQNGRPVPGTANINLQDYFR
jgi:hypothetical protein